VPVKSARAASRGSACGRSVIRVGAAAVPYGFGGHSWFEGSAVATGRWRGPVGEAMAFAWS